MANTLTKSFSEPKKLVEKKHSKNLLKGEQTRIPFIMRWDPRLPNVNAVIRKNLKLLCSEPENKKIFPKNLSWLAIRGPKI